LKKFEKKKTSSKTTNNRNLSNLSAEGRIRLRCKNDLKALATRVCTDKGLKNVNTIFTSKMLNEMIISMPTSREDLLKVTYFTEAIFNNYKGDEFLTILKHYSKLINENVLINEMVSHQKKFLDSEPTVQAIGFDDDHIFEDENDESEWVASSSSSTNKRSASKFLDQASKKKPRIQNNDETSSYFNTSGATQKKPYKSSQKKGFYGKKKKFRNFKKFKK
jgi:hypothetical protein